MSRKRRHSESFEEDEMGSSDEGGDAAFPPLTSSSAPKRPRTGREPTVLQRLLAIQNRAGGPRMEGHIHEGQTNIDLDRQRDIQARNEFMRPDGTIERDGVVQPNEPFDRAARAVFMKMVDQEQDDNLRPLLVAISGAINEPLEALYNDTAVTNRQRHSNIVDEWNRNEMHQLMSNISTKVTQIGHVRDTLYQKERVLDGHVQVNATMKAYRDLANVMYPNAEREQDFQHAYVNENEYRRHSSYPLIHILTQQRLFVNRLCNLVIDRRKDERRQGGASIVATDNNVLDQDIPSLFLQWFVNPHGQKLIDHVLLDTAFRKCQDAVLVYNKDMGISVPALLRAIRYLDWYIWLRDEMLLDVPHYSLDFHDSKDPPKRSKLTVATLLENTLQASLANYIVGVKLMKQLQWDAKRLDNPDGPQNVTQYTSIIESAAAAAIRVGGWTPVFENVLPRFMTESTFESFGGTFVKTVREIRFPRNQGYTKYMPDVWINKQVAWTDLDKWTAVAIPTLERLVTYVDLNGIDRMYILNAIARMVASYIQGLDVNDAFGDDEDLKNNILTQLKDKMVFDWTIDEDTDVYTRVHIKRGPRKLKLDWRIDNKDTRAYIRTWIGFYALYATYVQQFGSGRPQEPIEEAFDVLINHGAYLADMDVIDLLWDQVPIPYDVRNIGGYYASGIHHPAGGFQEAYKQLNMPTDLLIGVTNGILPNLLGPLAFVLTDTLIRQNIIQIDNATWSVLRDEYIDDVFLVAQALPGEPQHPIEQGYQAWPAIYLVRNVLATVTGGITADSFSADTLGSILPLVQENFRTYTTDRTMANILTHGHNWLLPALVLSAYLSQRSYTEQAALQKEYNELVKTYETMQAEYERMARGDRSSPAALAANKRYIREVVHEPDPTYLMLPMFTGRITLKPAVTQCIAKAMGDIKMYCPELRTMTLDELAHTPTESYLVTRFAEYLAASYALKQLIWPNRYKKDKEYTINPYVRKDAMEALKLYRLDADGTLWHTELPGRWPRKRDPLNPGAPRRKAIDV